MSKATEIQAIRLLKALEDAGKAVCGVVVEGRRIELKLCEEQADDEFERIDMRHGKT